MQLAPTPRFTAALIGSPSGGAQVWHTLALMRQEVRRARVSPDMLQAATSIIWFSPARDQQAECSALFDFVRDHIRYQQDVHQVETLARPEVTLQRRVGDCDDKATLLATLFEAVGYPTRFVVAGYQRPNDYEHVYLQVFCGGRWIDCDSTEVHPMGYAPPDPVALSIEAQ